MQRCIKTKQKSTKLIQNAQTQGILYVLMISMIKTSTQSNLLSQYIIHETHINQFNKNTRIDKFLSRKKIMINLRK